MNQSQWRVRPGFVMVVAGIPFLLMIASILLPIDPNKNINFAKKIAARQQVSDIASALNKYLAETKDGATDSALILRALKGSNTAKIIYFTPNRTNAEGEAIDYWETPYRIDLFTKANFLVRSAGPNQQFGDQDDII